MPIDQYHRMRNDLIREILRDLEPLDRKLPEDFEPFCHNCGGKKSEVNELHIHHADGNPEETSQDMSGWDYFYMYRRQFRSGGVTLWPICDICHFLIHRTWDDDQGENLKNHRKYLEDYEGVEPELELARRRERKQERLVEMVRSQESISEEPENGHDSILQELRDVLNAYAADQAQEIDEVLEFVDADEEHAKSALEEMKRHGEVFEPESGRVQLI